MVLKKGKGIGGLLRKKEETFENIATYMNVHKGKNEKNKKKSIKAKTNDEYVQYKKKKKY